MPAVIFVFYGLKNVAHSFIGFLIATGTEDSLLPLCNNTAFKLLELSINKRQSSALCVILNLNINPLTSMHVIMKYCKKSLFLFLYAVTSVYLSISFHCWKRDPRSSTNCLGTYHITECIMVVRDHPIIIKPCVIGKIWMHFRKQHIRLNVIQYSACLHNFLCLSVL